MRKLALVALFVMSIIGASAVGNWIVYTSTVTGTPGQVYMMNDDGTNNEQITMVDANNLRPYISKNTTGNMIAYDSDRDGNYEIYLMSDNGDKEVRITSDAGSDMDPTISGDLATIVYVHSSGNRNQLYKKRYLGVDPYNTANWSTSIDLSNSTTTVEDSPAISRDGQFIVYVSSPSSVQSQMEIWTMDLNGDNKTQITDNSFPDKHPDISPDGKFIVYYSTRTNGSDIYLYDIANKKEYQVTNTGNNLFPTFSVDGKSVGFSSSRFGGHNEICLIDISDLANLDNATVTRITNTAAGVDNRDPTMLPGTRPPTPAKIDAPVQVLPANGATNTAFNLTFQWNLVGIATRYNMQVSTDNQFVNIAYQTTQPFTPTTVDVTGLQPGTTYYWRVQAGDQYRWGSYSSLWTFRTKDPDLTAPVLASPVNAATTISLPPQLVWNAVSRATSYDIQVATDNQFTTTSLVFTRTGNTSLNIYVPSLLNNTRYYWRVKATSSTAQSAYSAVSYFNTGAVSLAAPTLVSPVTNQQSVSITPKLTWTTVTNAISYQYQLYTTSDLSGTPVSGVSNSTSATFITNALARTTKYYWRVRGVGPSNALGNWSNTGVFTTLLGPPTLVTPADNGSVNSPVTFTWAAYPLATQFILNISTTNAFTNVVRYTSTINSLPNIILTAGNYYWRVQATNGVSTSDWTTYQTFRVNAATVQHRPDMMIKALNDIVYQGEKTYYTGAYNANTANSQVSMSAVPYRKITTFLIKLRNDGNTTENYIIQLNPVGNYNNWKFRLMLNNYDLTNRATNGGYLLENVKPTTVVKAGDTIQLKLEASPYSTSIKSGATPDQFTIDVVATTVGTGAVVDVVRAIVDRVSDSRIK
jgi:Tol biopolymer transport system component